MSNEAPAKQWSRLRVRLSDENFRLLKEIARQEEITANDALAWAVRALANLKGIKFSS